MTEKLNEKRAPEGAGSLAAHWGKRDDVPLDIRQRLYPAVFEAFANNDYSNVGIRELSRLCGLSSATIYKYFESKEALLTTIYSEVFPFMSEELRTAVSSEATAKHNFRSMFIRLLSIYDQNHSMPIVFFITVPVKLWMQSGGWSTKEAWPVFEKVVKEGVLNQEIDSALSVRAIEGLFLMHVQREVQTWYYGQRQWKLSERVPVFFRYFWRSVENPEGSAEMCT